MVKQSDIAKLLNISRTTVARALNEKGSIKPETKKKILEACEELGYEKNPISTSLALKKKRNIYAFVVRTRNGYYTESFIKGLKTAQKELNMYKCNLNIIETHIDEPEKQIEEIITTIRSKEVDGIIVTPLLKDKIKEIKKNNHKIAFIALDLSLDNGSISVYSNYEKMGRISANILLNSLNRDDKVLLIDTEDDRISSKLCFQGVYNKLKEDGKCEIVGPIYQSKLKDNIPSVIQQYVTDDIKAIYSSRFLDDIINYVDRSRELKFVVNTLSKNIASLIEDNRIIAAVIQDYEKMANLSAKIMFECLYKGTKPYKNRNEYEGKIIVKENLNYETKADKKVLVKQG